jgi:hypothetical protein
MLCFVLCTVARSPRCSPAGTCRSIGSIAASSTRLTPALLAASADLFSLVSLETMSLGVTA